MLLFAGFGLFLTLRRGMSGPLPVAAAAAIGLHWLVVSTLVPWWAGFSTGPRLFSDVLPFFMVLMIPAVAWLKEGGRKAGAGRWAARGAFVLLIGFSLFTNGRGATRFETQLWNARPVSVDLHPSRVWDWDDLQFMR